MRGERINSIWLVPAASSTCVPGFRSCAKFIAVKVIALNDRRAAALPRMESIAFLKAVKPSGIALVRRAQSRNGPPSEWQTGRPLILPARSHQAISMPLMVGMWAM